MYLCHSFCELGATPLADGLRDIHDFLVTHPAEVVFIVNQDYVTPEDFVGAMDDAGLRATRSASSSPPLADPRRGDRRRAAADRARREPRRRGALVPARPTAGSQETPYSFGRAALLIDPARLAASCAPTAGRRGAPLFLINHWVTTAPRAAPERRGEVNAYGPLLARATASGSGRPPNLLAVNFYKRGDVFRVADKLNRVRP